MWCGGARRPPRDKSLEAVATRINSKAAAPSPVDRLPRTGQRPRWSEGLRVQAGRAVQLCAAGREVPLQGRVDHVAGACAEKLREFVELVLHDLRGLVIPAP